LIGSTAGGRSGGVTAGDQAGAATTRASAAAAPSLASLALLFFVSGAGALVAETTWMRWFRLLFGATAPAVSATLVAFLAGHAIGAWLAPRIVERQGGGAHGALRAYAGLELAAGLAAAAVPLLLAAGRLPLHALYDEAREIPGALSGLRFALALLATLPAAACFGATLPAIAAAVAPRAAWLGARGVALYAANTLGAAAGTAFAAFLGPDWWGVRVTYAWGIALTSAAGLGALLAARWIGAGAPAAARGAEAGAASTIAQPARLATARAPGASPRPAGRRNAPRRRATAPASGFERAATVLAALSGFVAFAAQVLLVSGFGQVMNGSVFAFGAVLVSVLVLLALGAAFVAALDALGVDTPATLLAPALVVAALGFAAFPAALHQVTGGFGYVGSDARWPGYLLACFRVILATAGLPLLAASLLFPLTFALVARAPERDTAPALARLVVANTGGAVLGALAAPWLLLPGPGLWPSFALLGALLAVAFVVVPGLPTRRRVVYGVALTIGAAILLLRASPLTVPPVKTLPGETLREVRSTPPGLVAVVEQTRNGQADLVIRVDNHSVLGGSAEIVHQERQAHLALLLAPDAGRVAWVGSATGISAGAALAHPIGSLHLVELVPAVADAARRHFGDANRGVYDDPRTTAVLDDGRNFLASTRARFDLVVADLFVPWRAGTGSMYAREHFEHVRTRLTPDGVFLQWLPLYQLSVPELEIVMATFLDAFPRTAVFRGDFYGGFPIAALVGYAGRVPSTDEISAAAERLRAAGVADRWVTDPVGLWALYVAPLVAAAPDFAATPRNDDDHPRIDFLAARGFAGAAHAMREPAVGPAWTRLTEAWRRAVQHSHASDPLFRDLDATRRRAGEGGAALQAAGAAWVAGRPDAAAAEFATAAELLPRHLVAEGAADPTAAEVWGE